MLERLIHDFLKELGEDPTREGLERTPDARRQGAASTSRPATTRTCTRC